MELTQKRRLRNILGGSAGSFVEWFDWFAYASFALYFSRAFFPQGDQTAQLLNAAFVFAGGFIARPVGALLLGRYADRHGRRAALTLSVGMMCLGSLLIAVVPTGLGWLSPLLLVLARLLQGLSVGGEYGASATYVSEMAQAGRRGYWSGFLYVTIIGGQLAAMLLQVLLQSLLSESQLYAWGWRVPFVVGACMAVTVFWIRRGIDETASFVGTGQQHLERGRVVTLFTRYRRETLTVVILTAGGGSGFYTYTTYMQKLLVNTAGLDKTIVSQVMVAVLATFLFFPPLVGWVADRLGHRRILSISFGGGALLAVPVLTALSHATNPWHIYLLLLLPLFVLSGYTALGAIFKAELYPAQVRALGVALPYALAMAVFGGNVETTALYLKQAGHEASFYWLFAALLAAGFAAARTLPETRLGGRI
jgi:MHS family alpha-ketoglutarate permease-like MFS transporter